jgi:hypothetical protein
VTPADIAACADFRAGLARRLAEVGLVPPDAVALRVAAPPPAQAAPADEQRKAA